MEDRIRAALCPWPTLLVALGLLLMFVAERLIGEGSVRVGLDVAAALSFVAALVIKGLRARGLRDDARRFVASQLSAFGLVALAVLAYAFYLKALGSDPDGHAAAIWFAIFAFIMAVAVVVLTALEILAVALRPAGFVEWRRARTAIVSSLGLVFALTAALAINYAAEHRNLRRDYSFGAPTSPSPATLSMLQASEHDLDVYLFLPRGSRLLAEVLDYFEVLEEAGAKLHVQDQALDAELAKTLKVSGNGYVALARGERNAKWYLGTELESSRTRLKRMDRELRTLFAQLTVAERVIYFTRGHGERVGRQASGKDRAGNKIFRDLVRSLNGKVKSLGLAEGLGGQVPDDASLVVIAGPTSAFLPEELAALQRYIDAKGSLLLMLDPGQKYGLDALLKDLGLEFDSHPVCNDRIFIQASHTDADHAFLVSNGFSSHPSVKSLTSARERATVALRGAGSLKAIASAGGKTPTFALRAMAGSYIDLNANFKLDSPDEKSSALNLLAVADRSGSGDKPARVAVLADSDALADTLLSNRPNLVLGYELVAWLLADDKLGGEIDSEEDVPIQHTRDGDTAWFYGTIFAAPLGVLGLGLALVYSNRRKRRTS